MDGNFSSLATCIAGDRGGVRIPAANLLFADNMVSC